MARDVSEVGHWDNGDYQVIVESNEPLDYLMTLIKHSYAKKFLMVVRCLNMETNPLTVNGMDPTALLKIKMKMCLLSKKGLYLFTIPFEGDSLVYYVGETGTSFSIRHKRVDSTMKCIQMLSLECDDFEVTSASTPEEIKKLGVASRIKYGEIAVNGIPMYFYKKPKDSQTFKSKL